MTGLEQNTADEKELSLGLLRQRRALILISIILTFFIFGFVTIENIEPFNGIKINFEELSIKIILLVLILYFWMRYCQYSKVDEKRIKLVKQMNKNIVVAIDNFFQNMACPNLRYCFDVKDCSIFVAEKVEAKNNGWFRKDKKIGAIGIELRYEDYFTGANHNEGVVSPAEIEKIESEGWSTAEKDFKVHEDNIIKGKPIVTKTFSYNPPILGIVLFWAKLKFYFTSTYFTDYLLPHYFAVISLSVFIADFFAFSAFIAVPCAIILVIFKNSKYYQAIKELISKKHLGDCHDWI